MKAAVAGTFNVLHAGHRALIDRAFSISDDVSVGITSDKMASATRSRLNPLYIRRKSVEDYLSTKNGRWKTFIIDDVYGPDEIMDDIDVLVVSEETLANGKKVSEERRRRSMKPLELSIVSLVKNDTGGRICSTDIINGKCARNGDSDVIDVAVGSLNPVKIEAVRCVMERIYGNVRIAAVDVESGVPEQPFGDETVKGAVNRATACLGSHDLGVGIEAGVFEIYGGLYDIQHCAVIDRAGKVTIGMGSGFRYPDSVSGLVRDGLTVGQAMTDTYTKDSRGHSEGAIGVLSKGLLDRKGLTEQSVLTAMLPRIWDE